MPKTDGTSTSSSPEDTSSRSGDTCSWMKTWLKYVRPAQRPYGPTSAIQDKLGLVTSYGMLPWVKLSPPLGHKEATLGPQLCSFVTLVHRKRFKVGSTISRILLACYAPNFNSRGEVPVSQVAFTGYCRDVLSAMLRLLQLDDFPRVNGGPRLRQTTAGQKVEAGCAWHGGGITG